MSGKNPETEQQIDSKTSQELTAGSQESEQEVRGTPPNEVCRNSVTTETNSTATDSASTGADLTSDSLAKEPQDTQERVTATAEQVATSGATESAATVTGAPTASSSVERQTSIGSIESGTMPSIVGGSGSGGSTGGAGSGFRNSLSNGRVSFSRFISVDRTRQSNNDMFSEILTLMHQARHPSSFFSSERRGIFLPSSGSGRSHTSGTSTPPSATGGHSSSEVVIDVDGGSAVGGTSLRSSQNELYPMSTSTSSASAGLRPFLWMQPTEDGGQTSGTANGTGGGRSPLMPNFNYNHHHHHHFHNHQPLSLHQNAQSSSGGVTIAGQSPSSTVGDIGNPSAGTGDPQQAQQSVGGGGPGTPTGSTMPTVGGAGATRSNSLSSNHPNDEATVHEALHQIPEARAMMDTLARYTPLLLILVAKLCYDHLDGIIYFFMLLITFYHANWVVRQEISKQKQRRLIVLLREMALIVLGLMVFGFVFEFSNIWLVVLFMPVSPQPQSLKSLLYSVCITDLILKQITIVIKIIFTLLPPTVVDYKSRGKIYLMIESLSQLYRAAAPIQPWLVFLFESYSGSEKMVGVILSAVYIVAKSTDLLDRIKFCRRSFIKLLQKTSYGTVPTKEQLQACGGQCSICHDNFNSPVLLECNHIFCELCVGTWFDREQTCPLCRAKIVDDPSYRDGATTFFLQLY
uniref:Putative ring finger and transmembrane domain-containing protein 2 n=1 Tax=Anopheles braziliensis TaxID=58242 RepID=A0A2M3Z4Z1_9DIPT